MKVELEITSDCNAACPGCARTLNKELLEIKSFSLQDLYRVFTPWDVRNNQFKFCGVLGDPIVHPDFLKMADYITHNNGYVEVSTNGGYNSADWWRELGSIAARHPGMLHIHFCADGHKETNHIYRVNTKWNVVERNMQAFAETAPVQHATWIYIVFDHNEHELDIAKEHAKRLGFNFATRTGMRNSYHQWIAQIGKKNNKTKKVITTTKIEHSKKDVMKEIDNFIKDHKDNKVDDTAKQQILDSIVCKYIHEDEIFVASDLTMWPCCFLYDSAFKNREGIVDKLNQFEPGWNSLRKHSVNAIKHHPWYKKLLQESWDPDHPLHFNRCIKTCAKNKAYHNEINYVDN